MKCDDVSVLLLEHADGRLGAMQSASVEAHLERCGDCACALEAVSTLRSAKERPIPEPRVGFFDQAMWIATKQSPPRQVSSRWRGFWSGVSVGGALAAGIVMSVMSSESVDKSPAPIRSTDLAIALHDTRDVMIAIDSRSEIAAADFRIVLTGGIDLTGYEGQSEVRWSAPLNRGVNMLTLPVMMQGKNGGHLVVEVAYGAQRQTYAVQLTAIG